MKTTYNIRAIAAKVINNVLNKGKSLSVVLPALQQNISDKDRTLLQELCFGTLRVLPTLEFCIQQLMVRPMEGKKRILHYLLMIGIYQLIYTRIPAHAALAETVAGATTLKWPQLKGLVNGVLRQFQRQQIMLLEQATNDNSHYLHPNWLLERIKKAYPEQWQQIVVANNTKPPMWLRVNRIHHSRSQYLALLQQAGIEAISHPVYADAIRLILPCPVGQLPGFSQGWVTVQDASAQGCIDLLDPKNGEYILDLCAAPGGKTTYILEVAPKAEVLAVDIDKQRLRCVKENLQRLQLQARIKIGDGRTPDIWCGEQLFDRILLDAPCSATGVIRRHPDIKWLRRDSDIAELTKLQAEIMDAIWPKLKKGGFMVYATCSILPEENQKQIVSFLARQPNAQWIKTGSKDTFGKQQLPHPEEGDGFFFAKMMKN